MNTIKQITLLTLMLTCAACGNKGRQAEPNVYEWEEEEAHSQPLNKGEEDDKMDKDVEKETPKAEEKSSVPVSSSSSSSRYQSSSSYDNMRGFDPASEDDTDDNGMSRYMENDDDEGWD